jgi:hypothetical protein
MVVNYRGYVVTEKNGKYWISSSIGGILGWYATRGLAEAYIDKIIADRRFREELAKVKLKMLGGREE